MEIRLAEFESLFDETVAFWRSWRASTYTGRWREAVQRSAITLKLMTYAPTGALVAAPTAALPEQVGGERNWDYRYTWVRDSSFFSVHALLALGFTGEAAQSASGWPTGSASGAVGTGRRSTSCTGSTVRPISLKSHSSTGRDIGVRGPYGSGSSTSTARPWTASTAADQYGLQMGGQGWQALTAVYEMARRQLGPARGRHLGIPGGGRQEFTYGRLMCWVAFDRAIRLATKHGCPPPPPRPA